MHTSGRTHVADMNGRGGYLVPYGFFGALLP